MSVEGGFRDLDVQTRAQDDFEILTVRGEVDMASAPQLQAALEKAQQGGKTLVVDMTEVGFLGSAGLSALLVVSKAAPYQLRVVASREVARPIELTGLDKLLAVYGTLEAAIAAEPNAH
ncbi:STAS domain-containing protein [Nocardia fluminea]|uniref:Anti-sigma factor antagonist n=1 Tax=Nocardia fluminea TaxID=134984 RepID=A0A2N3WVX3_9NOCA|nr:STAS domain-containing protein [Nocardia fluminea]PKV98004.1 anti-anti-sigma factor [Nocardia fluminea]